MSYELADHYQSLKEQEKNLKAALAATVAEIHADLNAGKPVVATDGTRYVQQSSTRREYKVSGPGGFIAFIRRNTELDISRFISVKAAEVKKLGDLAEGLSYVDKETLSIVAK